MARTKLAPADFPHRPFDNLAKLNKKLQALLNVMNLIREKTPDVFDTARESVEQFASKAVSGSLLFEKLAPLLSTNKDQSPWQTLIKSFPKEHHQWQKHAPLLRVFREKTTGDYGRFCQMLKMVELDQYTDASLVYNTHGLLCKESKVLASQELWTDFPELWAAFEASGLPVKKFRQERESLAAKKAKRIETAIQPKHVSADVLDLVAAYSPLPSMGRLARTCMFMRIHIDEKKLQAAKGRAAVNFGLFHINPRQEFILRSTNDETIGVSLFGRSFQSLRIQFQGALLLSEAMLDGRPIKELMERILRQPDEDYGQLWFRFLYRQDVEYRVIEIFHKTGARTESVKYMCAEVRLG